MAMNFTAFRTTSTSVYGSDVPRVRSQVSMAASSISTIDTCRPGNGGQRPATEMRPVTVRITHRYRYPISRSGIYGTRGETYNVQLEKVNSVAHGTWLGRGLCLSASRLLCPIASDSQRHYHRHHHHHRHRLSTFGIRHLAPLAPSDANQGSLWGAR